MSGDRNVRITVRKDGVPGKVTLRLTEGEAQDLLFDGLHETLNDDLLSRTLGDKRCDRIARFAGEVHDLTVKS